MSIVNQKFFQCRSGETVCLRSARQDDAFQINELSCDVFQTSDFLVTTPEEFLPVSEDHQRERVKRFDADEGSLLLVVQHGDELIGMLDFENGKKKRIAHKGTFAMSVRSSWRNKGIGKTLLRGLVEWVQSHPTLEVIALGVIEDNGPGVALYTRMGFQVTGREPCGLKLGDGRFLADLSMSLRVPKAS